MSFSGGRNGSTLTRSTYAAGARNVLAVAASLAMLFCMAGCGGNGVNQAPAGDVDNQASAGAVDNSVHTIQGIITPPTGFTGDLTSLRVAAPNATPVAADGS